MLYVFPVTTLLHRNATRALETESLQVRPTHPFNVTTDVPRTNQVPSRVNILVLVHDRFQPRVNPLPMTNSDI